MTRATPDSQLESRLSVLVIEDNPDDAVLIREALDGGLPSTAFDVTLARSFREALALLDGCGYGAVVCDLGLPDTQGLDTLRALQRASGDSPIIVLTGLADPSIELESIRSGAQDYLVKGAQELKMLGRVVMHASERSELLLEVKRAREREQYFSTHDSLTGLHNREVFDEQVANAIARCERHRGVLAMLFIDLDGFKQINDSLGHLVGDRVLRLVGERLRGSVRRSDAVCRFGGDEFSVLLTDLRDRNEAIRAAEHVSGALAQPLTVDGREIQPRASIGISFFPEHSDDANDLLLKADSAMYQAKRGRSGMVVFESGLDSAFDKQGLRGDLQRALEREEFLLHYQPMFDARTQRLLAVEALIRWNHSEIGILSPNKFLPLVEELGMAPTVGEWVLRTACAQISTWEKDRRRGFGIAVNLSPGQTQDVRLPTKIRSALHGSRVSAERLILEVPERGVHSNLRQVGKVLADCRELGVRVALDDFGMGTSSMQWLREFPVDVLKVDGSFIRRMPHSGPDRAIVSGLIEIARQLDLLSIAEGIETDDQYEWARRAGCSGVQGFLFGPPSPDLVLRSVHRPPDVPVVAAK